MGPKCFVPSCTSGYKSNLSKVSLFKAPRDVARFNAWKKAIPRTDKELHPNCHVCALHFPRDMIVTTFDVGKINGEDQKIDRERAVLRNDAIPCIFPNLPSYSPKVPFQKCYPGKRNLINKPLPEYTSTSKMEDLKRNTKVKMESKVVDEEEMKSEVGLFVMEGIKIEEEEIKSEIKEEVIDIEEGNNFHCSFIEENFQISEITAQRTGISNTNTINAAKTETEYDNTKHGGCGGSVNNAIYFCDNSEANQVRHRSENIANDYEKIICILKQSSDIEISDDDDEEYECPFPGAKNLQPQMSDFDDSDEEIVSAPLNLTTDGQTQQRKPRPKWEKKFFDNKDTAWKAPHNNVANFDGKDRPIPNPYDIFKQYIPDEFMQIFANYTNQYSIKKDGTSILTNANEIEALIGLHMKMGTLGFPRVRMYWSSKRGTRVAAIADTMPVKRFFKLRNYLHVVNTDMVPKNNDRLWKVRPLMDCIRKRCNKIQREEHYCIAEMKVPFTGKLNVKQYIKGKPNPLGLKIFVLCTSGGIVTDFLDYQGSTTAIDEENKKYGLGAGVVLQLCNIFPNGHNFKISFDNYFSSLPLLRQMKLKGLYGVGTIRSNRIENCPLKTEKAMKRIGRGCNDYRMDNEQDITVVRWYDNKVVTMASSFLDASKESEVERWDKDKKVYVKVKIPNLISYYNLKMGGVDQIDQYIAYYRIFIRSRKWTLRVIFHMVDLAVCNSWQEYRKCAKDSGVEKKKIMDLMEFRESVTDGLIKANKQILKRSSDFTGTSSSKGLCVAPPLPPGVSSRYDMSAHWPEVLAVNKFSSRCGLENCKERTVVICSKCKVHLCMSNKRNCFRSYHCHDT